MAPSDDKWFVDLEQRDPNNINDHIETAFEDVLAEPDAIRSCKCLWKTSYRCFKGSKYCCYKFLSGLMGLCIALYWGCCFACVAFNHIWCATPMLKWLSIEYGYLRKHNILCWESSCGFCCAPLTGRCYVEQSQK